MRHLETYQSFNEEIDLLSKIGNFLSKRIVNFSSEYLSGLRRDLTNFARSNNLSLKDLKDKKKIELVLLGKNEDYDPYLGPGYDGFSSTDNLTPEERKIIAQANAKWVIDNPILHKLSQYGFIVSLIIFIGDTFGVFFLKQSQIEFMTYTHTHVYGIAASLIVMIATLVFGNITISQKDAREELQEIKNRKVK